MPHPFNQLVRELIFVEPEEQHACSRPSVGCLLRWEVGFDTGLDLTTDDGRGETGHRLGSRPCPLWVAGRNQHACSAHAKGFGEGVDDSNPVSHHGSRLGWHVHSGIPRFPDENLTFAGHSGIASVPPIGPVLVVAGDGESERLQVSRVHT